MIRVHNQVMEFAKQATQADFIAKNLRPLAPSARKSASLQSLRRLSSEQLLGGAGEIEIDHAGVLYRLRVTSLGKLILTK